MSCKARQTCSLLNTSREHLESSYKSNQIPFSEIHLLEELKEHTGTEAFFSVQQDKKSTRCDYFKVFCNVITKPDIAIKGRVKKKVDSSTFGSEKPTQPSNVDKKIKGWTIGCPVFATKVCL